MAKAGMRRPNPADKKARGSQSSQKQNFPDNGMEPVPELEGKAKTGNKKAGRM